MNHVTIATSSGAILMALLTHFGGGLVALVAGFIALVVAKGGRLHKQSGMVFTWAMGFAGLFAAIIAGYEGKTGMVVGGLSVIYFVFTATTTVKPLPGYQRPIDAILMVLVFATAALTLRDGTIVWALPGHARQGVPGGMLFFLGTVYTLAGIGDARVLRDGGITGSRRLARHLWRMCFALFIATGSFFLGQAKFIPAPIRILPLLMVLGIAPLFVLLDWMWRVRLRNSLRGLIVRADPSLRSG